MKFGTEVLVERGSDTAPQGQPGSRRFIRGVLTGAQGWQRIVRLLEDDPLDTVGWSKAGQVGRWSADAVRAKLREGEL